MVAAATTAHAVAIATIRPRRRVGRGCWPPVGGMGGGRRPAVLMPAALADGSVAAMAGGRPGGESMVTDAGTAAFPFPAETGWGAAITVGG